MNGKHEMNLGACCICEKNDETVINVIALHFRAPILGTGWGCFKCGMPNNGALVVICDECMETYDGKIDTSIKFIVSGYPAKRKRIPIELVDVKDRFQHDMAQHVDEVAHLN